MANSGRGGIEKGNLHPKLQAMLLPDQGSRTLNEALQGKLGTRPGACASNVLSVPASVVDGDTITIGADTFEVDIINTDSGVNTHASTGALLDTEVFSTVILTAAPATALVVGEVLRIESEMLLVVRIVSTSVVVALRGYAGTTVATHAANTDVFVSNAVPVANISVPLVTTLTPAAFGPAFAAVVNLVWPTATEETQPDRSSSLGSDFTVYSLGAGQEIVIQKDEAGEDATACTEDFAASTDNLWSAATLTGGVDPAVAGHEVQVRAATTVEELVGRAIFFFPFTVRAARVTVRTSAGVEKAFTGTVLVGTNETTGEALPDTTVSVRNVGAASTAYAVVFAATDILTVEAFE